MPKEGYSPLGKTGVRPRGEYVSGMEYERLDLVYYDGSTYLALVDTSVRPIDDQINWMLIVQGTPVATTDLLGKVKPDGTTITVEEDGTIHGAKQVPDNVLVAVEIGEDDPDLPIPQAPPIDADRLGGELPEHYATKQSVTDVENKIGALDELSTEDKATLVKAINELYTTNTEETKNLDKAIKALNTEFTNTGLGNNILNFTKWDGIEKDQALTAKFFTNWTNEDEFPSLYGSGILIPALDSSNKFIIYTTHGSSDNKEMWLGYMKFTTETEYTITWRKIISSEELPEIVSNPNLLMNPDFKINQRGISELTSNGKLQYICDRWFHFENDSISVVKYINNHIVLYRGRIGQKIENLKAGTYTITVKILSTDVELSVYKTNDVLIGTIPAEAGMYSFTTTFSNGLNEIFIQTNPTTNGVIFEWIKLELGNIATQFIPPERGEELMKCQYYYKRFCLRTLNASGYYAPENRLGFTLHFGKMRSSTPTCRLVGTQSTGGTNNHFAIVPGGNYATGWQTSMNTQYTVTIANKENARIEVVLPSNFTVTNKDFVLYFGENAGIEVEAEIY